MIDNNRRSGRTTRMLCAAYGNVLANFNVPSAPKTEVVVSSVEHVNLINNTLNRIIPPRYRDCFNVITHDEFMTRGRGKREFTFIDHHVHFLKLVALDGDIKQLHAKLNSATDEFNRLLEVANEY